MIRSAAISEDGKFRYRLDRCWFDLANDPRYTVDVTMGPRAVVFIMLNPSTADAEEDDPTIRRCIAFCKSWGYFALTVVNLYAFRATDPRALLEACPAAHDYCKNDSYIIDAVNHAPLVIAAWGASPHPIPEQADRIAALVRQINPRALSVLGFTRGGHPRHPLYVSGSTRPSVWTPEYSPARIEGVRQ